MATEVVVIFGGRSEIGLEIARRLAPTASVVVLAARPAASTGAAPVDPRDYDTSDSADAHSPDGAEKLALRIHGSADGSSVGQVAGTADDVAPQATGVAADGEAAGGFRGARVEWVSFDADDVSAHRDVVADIEDRFGPIGTAVLAFGILGDQARAERDEAEVARILHTDFVAQASLLTVLADRMRNRPVGEHDAAVASSDGRAAARSGSGHRGRIVAFSSVAGVRVRRANYVYGSAKAGLDGFASGLADALHGSGVDLVIARPGFVIGRMTQGMKPAIFSSTPDQVADAVVARLRSGGPRVLWIPGQLRALFAVARVVPASVWRRMPR